MSDAALLSQADALLASGRFQPHTLYRPDDEDRIEESCAPRMYFERHRQFCVLPELMLPAKPEWSCILWRI